MSTMAAGLKGATDLPGAATPMTLSRTSASEPWAASSPARPRPHSRANPDTKPRFSAATLTTTRTVAWTTADC